MIKSRAYDDIAIDINLPPKQIIKDLLTKLSHYSIIEKMLNDVTTFCWKKSRYTSA